MTDAKQPKAAALFIEAAKALDFLGEERDELLARFPSEYREAIETASECGCSIDMGQALNRIYERLERLEGREE